MAVFSYSLLGQAVFVLVHINLVFSAEWTYSGSHGPEHWSATFPKCGGKLQSPINIVTPSVQTETLRKLIFKGYDAMPKKTELSNNGYSVVLTVEAIMSFVGMELLGPRRLAQLHFHWGSDGNRGSEHFIDGSQAPLEMHMVHYDESHGNITNAMSKQSGLAVLGFLFEEVSSPNDAYSKIVDKLSMVQTTSTTVSLDTFPLSKLFPANLDRFYRYYGSLTTPTCDQSVDWVIFEEKIKISSSQLAEFRKLKATDGSKMMNTFRPVQALNGRIVRASFVGCGSITPKPVFLLTVITILTARVCSLY